MPAASSSSRMTTLRDEEDQHGRCEQDEGDDRRGREDQQLAAEIGPSLVARSAPAAPIMKVFSNSSKEEMKLSRPGEMGRIIGTTMWKAA